MAEPWKVLFARALEQLEQGGVKKRDWAFGGGTVLTHRYNHRESKDIDIFFQNAQLMGFISPRVNDAVEATLLNYTELPNHTRLQFKEGEIDFILASQRTELKPSFVKVLDSFVNVEHPVEIIAKKIHYRADVFKPRDVFDLAVVFNAQRDSMLKNSGAFADKLPILSQRIDDLAHSGELENRLSSLAILPGGEKVRGKEVGLCRQFIQAVEKRLEKGVDQGMSRGLEL